MIGLNSSFINHFFLIPTDFDFVKKPHRLNTGGVSIFFKRICFLIRMYHRNNDTAFNLFITIQPQHIIGAG